MRIVLFVLLIGSYCSALAQPAPVTAYTISQVALPAEMDKQVCISGLKYVQGRLLFASERCPLVFSADPATGTIDRRINTEINTEFEVEGLTSFRQKLYLVSENQVAVYEMDPQTGKTRAVTTSIALPPKSKSGDGMEGIAANEKHAKFYILRERNERMTHAEIFSFTADETDGSALRLNFDSKMELPLENSQWRYSDICYDNKENRLLCLKSYSKGKTRQQYIETIDIDEKGNLVKESVKNLLVENFSSVSNQYKDQHYSMNLEGITIDEAGNIYVVSDNTSGNAQCDRQAKERTILLKLIKN
jgi:uncharacterized protein YjiK